MGNVILRDGHAICPDNIKAILDFGTPRSKTEVCGFLVSVNFLRRFYKDISKIVAPLTSLTGKAPFVWSKLNQAEFKEFKAQIAFALVLAHPNFEITLIIETEASNFAQGQSSFKLVMTDQSTQSASTFRRLSLRKPTFPYIISIF